MPTELFRIQTNSLPLKLPDYPPKERRERGQAPNTWKDQFV